MIEIPIHNMTGQEVDSLQVDEALLGGEVRHALLKQAYVRYHANRRQGSAHTRGRSDTSYSTRKLYRQKGTGSARRGAAGSNVTRGGGRAFAKSARSFRQKMPTKMRRLANRNAILAKAIDGEIKLVDTLNFEKPSTGQFSSLLTALKIDRTCLVALNSTVGPQAKSARNLESVSVTHVDQLNVFEVLNHRYLLIDKATLQSWLTRAESQLNPGTTGAASQGEN